MRAVTADASEKNPATYTPLWSSSSPCDNVFLTSEFPSLAGEKCVSLCQGTTFSGVDISITFQRQAVFLFGTLQPLRRESKFIFSAHVFLTITAAVSLAGGSSFPPPTTLLRSQYRRHPPLVSRSVRQHARHQRATLVPARPADTLSSLAASTLPLHQAPWYNTNTAYPPEGRPRTFGFPLDSRLQRCCYTTFFSLHGWGW